MKKLLTTSLFALFVAVFSATPIKAADYTIEPKADGAAAVKSRAIPLLYNAGGTWGSVSQQIYLASELKAQGASAGDITGINFYYSASSNVLSPSSRQIQVFIMEIPTETVEFEINASTARSTFLYVSATNKTAGTKVFEGSLSTEAINTSEIKKAEIGFDSNFFWDGESNIVLTVFDMSAVANTVSTTGFGNIRFLISKTNGPRFLSKKWYSSGSYQDTDDRAAWIADISNNLAGREGELWSSPATQSGQYGTRSYVNKIDFTIESVALPSVPTGLTASDASTTSITLSWSAASSATAYDLQYKDGESWIDLASDIDETSYTWTGRDANTSYEVRVRASNSAGKSDWSDAVSVSTEPEFVYKEITFEKWNSTTSMPLSGNYYLANDVELSGNVSLSGNLNLCLNGHKINTYVYNIVVPDEKKLAIYDNEGDGQIYGYYVGNNASYYGLISVVGELVLSEGTIRNLYEPESGDVSYAIYNNGTFKLSGAPTITGNTADIHLWSNKYITIESGKPITNTTPYSVNAAGQVITSGWSANMGDANPSTHFTSAKSGYSGLTISEGEVKLVQAISLSQNDSEETFNSKISGKTGIAVNVSLDRTFTSASYNTICLPFALSDAQLQSVFGSDYDLEEFTGSSVNGEELDLSFNKVTSLTAGQPYLIQPSEDVSDPTFTGVTISATIPEDQTGDTYVSFHGVFAPTELAANNHNLLFLGAANTLFWPNETAPINGFRAYFEIKEGSAAQAAKRARIVNRTDEPTAIDQTAATAQPAKRLVNGQLLIDFNGKTYNAQGILIK